MRAIDRFDTLIAYLAASGWPRIDWRFIKAQALQESSMRTLAVSPAGAVGLLQLMPGTFPEAVPSAYRDRPIEDPEANLAAGIRYLRIQFDHFPEVPESIERLKFAVAAYNCGRGYLNAALVSFRRRHGLPSRGPSELFTWERVKPHLATVQVAGRSCYYGQTWKYVDAVFGGFGQLSKPRWWWQVIPNPIRVDV